MASITWVLDSSSRYEVSSKEHLLQIMNTGALFTDEGSAPSDYMLSSYIQTADIDLFGETVVPIGTGENRFEGTYDGGNNKISNWSLDGIFQYAGLFGYGYNAIVKNIVLAGVWYLDQSSSTIGNGTGFLFGFLYGGTNYSSNIISGIINITTDFESGTVFLGHENNNNVGTLVGGVYKSTVQGITLGGVISTCEAPGDIGGVIGNISSCSDAFMIRNIATFENGIVGNNVGGVFLRIRECRISFVMNAMKGDITGTSSACGITYYWYPSYDFLDVIVNSMTGNIQGLQNMMGMGLVPKL